MLFGAHFGVAVEAKDHPDLDAPIYDFEALYTGELWHNAHGGLRTGTQYLDNLDLTLSVDGERAWGVPGLTAFAYVIYNSKGSFSEKYVGDAMTVSNIDAPRALRLYEAWLDWTSSGARPLSVRFGLYDMNSEFDTSDSRALFIHSTHGVGHELAQTGENGPSIFPVTSLALRLAWEPAQSWRLLAAVMDGVPGDRKRPERSGIHLSSEEGALAMAEAQWTIGATRLSLGHWRYTADFADLRSTDEAPLPERDDNVGTYGAAELALRRAADGASMLGAFLRYGVANGRINEFDDSISMGLRGAGLWAARPDDELGVAVTRANLSRTARRIAAAEGSGLDRHESAIELTYRAVINDWLTLQPDVQYIINPGTDASLSNSVAFGLRFEFTPITLR